MQLLGRGRKAEKERERGYSLLSLLIRHVARYVYRGASAYISRGSITRIVKCSRRVRENDSYQTAMVGRRGNAFRVDKPAITPPNVINIMFQTTDACRFILVHTTFRDKSQ